MAAARAESCPRQPRGPTPGRPSRCGRARQTGIGDLTAGCHLEVSEAQQADLDAWLQARGLKRPLILIQVGNKRTMRRGLRRLAVNNKYWPTERWAAVIRYLRARCPAHPDRAAWAPRLNIRLNQELAALAKVEGVCNAADDLPIPRLVALLRTGRGAHYGRFRPRACRGGGGLSAGGAVRQGVCPRCIGLGERRAPM